jgi:putative hydrolase of the HAD superfamily
MSSADDGLRKPNRYIFEVAIKKMGLPAEDIWFVGDRLDNDVAGAIDAGLCPVWYNPKNRPRSPAYECLEVKDWQELQEMLQSLR